MPTANSNGTSDKWLWKGTYKINHDDAGFTYSVWVADKILADARVACEAIGLAIRRLLPQDAEIYDAIMYKWDTARNGAQMNGVMGAGLYGSELAAPEVLHCDNPRTALKVRFEDLNLAVIPRIFNLIPDTIIAGGLVDDPITNVVGQQVAAPAPAAATADYKTQFNVLLKALMFYTHHVGKNPIAGGAYTFEYWLNAYVNHVSVKRGGHVFTG